MREVVWLTEDRRFAFLEVRRSYYSIVSVQISVNEWEQCFVKNDDYEMWEERSIDYQSDGG